jgi:signal transduction histidine kinase
VQHDNNLNAFSFGLTVWRYHVFLLQTSAHQSGRILAVINLITNAMESMAAADEPRTLCIKAEAYERDGVMVSVADIGTGVDPLHLDRIFNPLFTTKPDGMGMGLSICRAIIEAHDGRLSVSPNIPRGAIFRFTLHGNGSASASA